MEDRIKVDGCKADVYKVMVRLRDYVKEGVSLSIQHRDIKSMSGVTSRQYYIVFRKD